MKRFSPLIAAWLVSTSLATSLAAPAWAQVVESEGSGGRIEKLERDIMLLQRQIARGGDVGAGSVGGGAPTMGGADVELRLSALEEQIRTLSGKLEEAEFQNRKLSQNLDKLQTDTDFRFNDLAHTTPAPAAATSKTEPAKTDATKAEADKNTATANKDKSGKSIGKTVDTAEPQTTPPAAAEESKNADGNDQDFASAREHYNYAFRLLNQTQYDKAAASFAAFTKKYPKDPLAGNAYYWLGETFYIRRDYVNAADSFRQGFEELPAGPKAPDNLLKLAMSLNALKRDKEACVVLGQVVSKFKKTAGAVTQKAEQELQRLECKQ